MNDTKQERIALYDILKCLLIVLVVFGHFLCNKGVPFRWMCYIYTFHMPVFVYLSAKTNKFHVGRATLYLLVYILGDIMGINLWYFFALDVYMFLTPYLKTIAEKKKRIFLIAGSVAMSVLTTILPVNREIVLIKTVGYLPFYLLGLYGLLEMRKKSWGKTILLIALSIVVSVIFIFIMPTAGGEMSCWSNAYHLSYLMSGEIPVVHRLILIGIGCLWVLAMMSMPVKKEIPAISSIGKNTLWIYAFSAHVQAVFATEFLRLGSNKLLPRIGLSLCIVLLLWPVSILLNKLVKKPVKKVNDAFLAAIQK